MNSPKMQEAIDATFNELMKMPTHVLLKKMRECTDDSISYALFPDKDISEKTFDGARAFQLKATHGIPLDQIITSLGNRNAVVKWDEYIIEARKNNRFDYQTLEEIKAAYYDAGYHSSFVTDFVQRFKLFVLRNPL